MSDQIDETFEAVGGSGASTTYPQQAGTVRKNAYIVINGRPCKVADISTSKTGKHGHAKANITAIDIFNGRKYEDVYPTSHNVDVPNVTRLDYSLIDVADDGFVSLMTADGSTKDDLKLPEGDLGAEIKAAFDAGTDVMVSVMAAMNEEHIMSWKASNN